MAQKKTITGVVTDATGEAVIGASIGAVSYTHLVITVHGSISVPVPAVVGMAIMGSALVTGRPLPLPPDT